MAPQLSAKQSDAFQWIAKFAIALFILFNLPSSLRLVIEPFILMAVLVHEGGHAYLTILTGGRVLSVGITANEGGLTSFSGGNTFFSLPAGYLSVLTWGAVLLYAGFSSYYSQVALAALAAYFGILLIYTGNTLTTQIIIFGIATIAVALYYDNGKYCLQYCHFLGTAFALFGIYDVIDDNITRNISGSDSNQFAQLVNSKNTGAFYAQIWLFMGLAANAGALYFAVQRLKDPGAFKSIFRK